MLIKSLATDDQLNLQLLSSPSGWMEMLKIAGGPTVAFAKSPEEVLVSRGCALAQGIKLPRLAEPPHPRNPAMNTPTQFHPTARLAVQGTWRKASTAMPAAGGGLALAQKVPVHPQL